jgi:hypothetical protein
MAIAPMDLQMLFSQIDKIGKEVAQQKEGVQLHNVIRREQQQRLDEEKIQSVRDADDAGEGLEHLKDRKNDNPQGAMSQDGDGSGQDGEKEADAQLHVVQMRPVQDPNLGQFVDLKG